MPAIPPLLSALYLYSKNFGHNAYVFHIFTKSSYWGIFFSETIRDFYQNAGPVLLILFMLSEFISFVEQSGYMDIKFSMERFINKHILQ